MKFRSFLISLTAFSLVFAQSAFGIQPDDSDFPDVDWGDENYEAVSFLKDKGVVIGYQDGEFKPDRKISRAEFLKIVMESGEVAETAGDGCFEDSEGHWGEFYICAGVEKGIIEGYADGTFRPNAEINFVEAAKIVAKVMELEVKEVEGEWFEKYVNALVAAEAVPVSLDGFDQHITRGEMSEIVWRIMEKPEGEASLTYGLLRDRAEAIEEVGKLAYFDSCEDLNAYHKNAANEGFFAVDEEMVAMPMASRDLSTGAVLKMESDVAESAPADDFSATNVQVAGVDEADIVKNDGQYIYVLKGDEVRIVKAYPADEMREMDKVDFGDEDFYPSDMYLDGDYLTVIGSTYSERFDYSSATRVYVVDVSDKSDAEVYRNMVFKGSEVSTRKVEDMLYLVLNDYSYLYDGDVGVDDVLPVVLEGEEKIAEVPCNDILYYPGEFHSQQMIIAAVDLVDKKAEVDMTSVVGSSGNVYASRDNIYVAENSYNYGWWRMDKEMEEETIIHKFSLEDGVDYVGKGKVPGSLLNQFSMDEYDGNFRVATTKGNVWDDENKSTNNVYVLDGEMKVVGELEGVAPGERIYSVRFMGEKAYMVTFKKVDPFFVLDLSNPRNPNILGELKLPGYSDYLHPFGDDYVIGFGKDAVDASAYDKWNRDLDFAWYQGLKIAMFDVSDVSDPQVLHSLVIGDRGTESELLYNHKALMFDANKGIMAFPISISEIPEELKADPETPADAFGKRTFEGAIAFEVSAENGFEELGRVTHFDEGEMNSDREEYWYSYNSRVLRALYMGDYMYTVSNDKVKANNLKDFDEEYEVEFDGSDEEVYYVEY